MKKNILTYIIYVLFAVGTITTLFIVYKDIDSSFSLAFVIGYIIFLFSLFLFHDCGNYQYEKIKMD